MNRRFFVSTAAVLALAMFAVRPAFASQAQNGSTDKGNAPANGAFPIPKAAANAKGRQVQTSTTSPNTRQSVQVNRPVIVPAYPYYPRRHPRWMYIYPYRVRRAMGMGYGTSPMASPFATPQQVGFLAP